MFMRQAGNPRVFSGEVAVVKENVAASQALDCVPSLSSLDKCDQRVAGVATLKRRVLNMQSLPPGLTLKHNGIASYVWRLP